MTIVRDSYEAFTSLEVALRKIFTLELGVPDDLAQFYTIATSQDASEDHHGDQGFGDVPEFTGKIEYEDSTPLWRKQYKHLPFAKGLSIERELVDDEKWSIINRKTTSFGMAFARNIATARASVFNNAFNDAYAGPDGVGLVSDSHDYSPVDGTHQSNEFTYALTHANVVTVREAMMSFVDPKGNLFPVVPDTLVVPVALGEEAFVITQSAARSGTANNDANSQRGLRVVVSPYLTDSNAWFLADSRMSRLYLNWYWRVPPEFAVDPTSQFDLVWRYRGYMRYSFGWDDYRWIAGSNPG
jgi:hypothetical protein